MISFQCVYSSVTLALNYIFHRFKRGDFKLDKVQLIARLPKELREDLKRFSSDFGISANAAILELIKLFVSDPDFRRKIVNEAKKR